MIKRALMAAVAAGGLLTALAVTPSAEALPVTKVQAAPGGGLVTPVMRGGPHGGLGGGGHHMGGGLRFYGGGGGRHFHHGGGFRRGLYLAPFVGYGAYYYGGYGGYGSGCGWLRRRAEATGSRYWWARYEECLED